MNTTSTLIVTLVTNLVMPPNEANNYVRMSVLPILDFPNKPHPNNTFLAPLPFYPPVTVRYSFKVLNFGQCDRVAVILNGVNSGFSYNYAAEVTLPPPGTPMPPCYLQLSGGG